MDYNPCVILISSNSITVIEAKLEVYRACRAIKYPHNFFIHHYYDDKDDISKLSAFCKATFICDKIKSMTNNFSQYRILDMSQIVYDEVREITRRTLLKFCAGVASGQTESYIGTRGLDHPTADIVLSIQMLLQETIKRTSKYLGFLIYQKILSFAGKKDAFRETIPQEVCENILFETMKMHVFFEYETSIGFERSTVDDAMIRRKVANNLSKLIGKRRRTISESFENAFKETMMYLEYVCITLENFRKKCRPRNMSECKYFFY